MIFRMVFLFSYILILFVLNFPPDMKAQAQRLHHTGHHNQHHGFNHGDFCSMGNFSNEMVYLAYIEQMIIHKIPVFPETLRLIDNHLPSREVNEFLNRLKAMTVSPPKEPLEGGTNIIEFVEVDSKHPFLLHLIPDFC
jgi:hypothetical protein